PYPVLGLAERAAGAWEGLTHAEIDTRHPGARQGSWRPEGYEHDEELRARARAALRPFEEARVLAVTHEGLIRALDGDPDPLPNLAARWVVVEGDAIRPEGERISLRT
ncbi:MAG: phosphoglycerate mutase family protein, partial [Solirubrobacterales bacterium]|nr:phosphoglycerate mutase family protein [Solirubrobacterales bacterium]